MPTTDTTPRTRPEAAQLVIETLVTRSGLTYPEAARAADLIVTDLGWAA